MYIGASWLFIGGGVGLFVGGMIETALSADRSLSAFVLVGILCCVTVGLGFAFRILAAARESGTQVTGRWTDPSSPEMGRWFRRVVVALIGVAMTAAGVQATADGDSVGVAVAFVGLTVTVIGATGRWSAFRELLRP